MSTNPHILLAEDEPALGLIVKESLESRGFRVTLCPDGEAAWEAYLQHGPELLVLDVMMPKKDGFSVAKEVRMQDQQIPILFLTAKSQPADVVEGFTLGGDDYLKKPFSMEELIIRIQNLLQRRDRREEKDEMSIGQYVFFPDRQVLAHQDKEQRLTHREAQLLFHLRINRNKVLDRSIILKKLWHDDDVFSARSMDVFISKLRKKLKADPEVQIVNVRGYGYKLIC
jgi:DNA-binding response OmpR family regulator